MIKMEYSEEQKAILENLDGILVKDNFTKSPGGRYLRRFCRGRKGTIEVWADGQKVIVSIREHPIKEGWTVDSYNVDNKLVGIIKKKISWY